MEQCSRPKTPQSQIAKAEFFERHRPVLVEQCRVPYGATKGQRRAAADSREDGPREAIPVAGSSPGKPERVVTKRRIGRRS